MSKKLKTVILISSLILIVFFVGLIAISMLSNVSSIEIYDFRIIDKTSQDSQLEDDALNYEIYLTAQKNQNIISLSDVYAKTSLVDYEFISSDNEVAVVELNQDGTAYQIYGKEVGYAIFSVKKITKSSLADEEGIVENLDSFACSVYRELTSCYMYLTTPQENFKEFTIKSSATNNNFKINFVSTDPNVATVVKKDNRYFINALAVGTATITAYCDGNLAISDSFVVNVLDNQANNLEFVKSANADEVINEFEIYDDGTYYSLYYKLTGSDSQKEVNSANIKISSFSVNPVNINAWDDDSISDKTTLSPFDSLNDENGSGLILDIENHRIQIKKSTVNGLKSDDPNDIPQALGFISVSTFIFDDDNEEVITGTYTLPINVYHTVKIGTEIELSATPEFSENAKNIYNNFSDVNWKRIIINGNFYDVQAEDLIINSVDELYYNSQIKTIHMRAWTVYNNGDRKLEKEPTTSSDAAYEIINSSDSTYGTISILISGDTITCQFYIENIEIKPLNNIALIRSTLYLEEGSKFKFNYWDYRFRLLAGEITDVNGDIVGFAS